MAQERETDELLEQLRAAASPEAYLDAAKLREKTLAQYACELMHERGLDVPTVILDSGLNATYCYEMLGGRKTRPGRDYVIKLAFGLHCDLLQAQRLLRRAGLSELWSKSARDAIIIHCLEHGLTRQQTDDELYRLGQDTLVSERG